MDVTTKTTLYIIVNQELIVEKLYSLTSAVFLITSNRSYVAVLEDCDVVAVIWYMTELSESNIIVFPNEFTYIFNSRKFIIRMSKLTETAWCESLNKN